jgi:hypothetical protein
MWGCIYVIKNERGPVKIGAALNPVGRLKAFQKLSPDALTLEFYASVDGNPMKVETRAHERLAHAHIVREWFNVSVEEAIASIHVAAHELGLSITPQRAISDGEGVRSTRIAAALDIIDALHKDTLERLAK